MNPKTLALITAARAKHAALQLSKQQAEQQQLPAASLEQQQQPASNLIANMTNSLSSTEQHLQTSKLEFNSEQLTAIELGLQGKSFCLIGAAGTGKTTVTQELIARLQQAAHMRPLIESTKHLNKDSPAIVICGFTNKAVNNIKKKLPTHLQDHCITIHKLLEYSPVYYQTVDDEGLIRNTMRFEPARNAANPLPHISTIIFEEASMIGTELFGQVLAALLRPAATQIIFLGDLNQLPPVFGPSILGFKLADLTTVELTHVYRQALASPIISLATAIRTNCFTGISSWLSDKLVDTIKQDSEADGNVTIKPWKKRATKESALATMGLFLPKLIASKEYNPEDDMILCPFNKSFGTVELNKIIADYLTKQRDGIVYEVIARYTASYWAVGDRVLVDRHEAQIVKIEPTIGYSGKLTREATKTLNRWGVDSNSDSPNPLTAGELMDLLDTLGGNAASADDETKNLASHSITVYLPDLDQEKTLTTAGEINNMLLGYCLTVHKSQGSEWQKVFIFLHDSHSMMCSRELLYTAVTRAKHSLYVICEGDTGGRLNTIKRAADRAIIPGTLLSEKIAYFKDKAASMQTIEY